MRGPDRLQQMLEPTVAGLGYELLGIDQQRLGTGLLLRLYIDAPDGITVDDCERVSRQVEGVLEAEEAVRGAYTLEVSSPGMDRPLFTLAQYLRHRGAQVQIRLRAPLDGRRRLQGVLVDADADVVTLRIGDESLRIPGPLVERARLVPEWPSTARGRRMPKKRASTTGEEREGNDE